MGFRVYLLAMRAARRKCVDTKKRGKSFFIVGFAAFCFLSDLSVRTRSFSNFKTNRVARDRLELSTS